MALYGGLDLHGDNVYCALLDLPEGYVYPREARSVRDLLRRRMKLVRARTGEWLSL